MLPSERFNPNTDCSTALDLSKKERTVLQLKTYLEGIIPLDLYGFFQPTSKSRIYTNTLSNC